MLFTSHPDKMCDQMTDAILDAHLSQDPQAKVACEVVCCTGMVMIFGEISSKASGIDYQQIDILSLLGNSRDVRQELNTIHNPLGL